MTLFQLMETDFGTFFLLLETIIEIRQNSIFKKYYCSGNLIRGRRNGFSGVSNHFFLHFSKTRVSFFFRLVEKCFSTKSTAKFQLVERDFLASGNRFHLLRVFPSGERVTKINGSHFLKKYHFLTNENWFLG